MRETRTVRAMRKELTERMEVGKEYVLKLPKLISFGETAIRPDFYRLLKIYPNICLVEDRRGVKSSFPHYEMKHLLDGEPFQNTKPYKGNALVIDERNGISIT